MACCLKLVTIRQMQMNLFSGALKIDWYWHQVHNYRPLGAIRAVKKRYSDHKSFTADCDLMKKKSAFLTVLVWRGLLNRRGLFKLARQWQWRECVPR